MHGETIKFVMCGRVT